MNYSRNIDDVDPLPAPKRKVTPELKEAPPTREEAFEQGDHKALEDVARGTVASSGDESTSIVYDEQVGWRTVREQQIEDYLRERKTEDRVASYRAHRARFEEMGWDAVTRAFLDVCDQRDDETEQRLNLQRLCDTQQARIAELEARQPRDDYK